MTLYPAPKPSPRSPKALKRLQRATGVRKRNPGRRKSEFARAYGSRERVAFVKRQPCVSCASRSNIQNHHIVNGGAGRKADAALIVPLCGNCHWVWHHYGVQYLPRLNWPGLAASTELAWRLAGVSGGQEGAK